MEPVVALVPIGTQIAGVAPTIAAALRERFAADVAIHSGLHLAANHLDTSRGQYRAAHLVDDLARVRQPVWESVLGVTDADLFAPGVSFVLGEADAVRRLAVISLARLGATAHGILPDSRLLRRACAEASRHLGLAYGLKICHEADCLMQPLNPAQNPTGAVSEGPEAHETFCAPHRREMARALRRLRGIASRSHRVEALR